MIITLKCIQHNEANFVVSERFISNLKSEIYKHMNTASKTTCISKIDDIVDKYNEAYHKAIKIEPTDVMLGTYIKVLNKVFSVITKILI